MAQKIQRVSAAAAAQATPRRFGAYNPGMRIWKRRQSKAPTGETGQEALYLKSLSERQVPVQIKLRDGEVVSGWIEYFDDMMLRLTREGRPNLFIYKSQIRTLTENTPMRRKTDLEQTI